MFTSSVKYLGHLRTQATHLASGNFFITDAPIDNHGKGEYFSPTDTLATSLATCMITLMGIAAETHQIKLTEMEAKVTKHMVSNPRRVGKIEITFTFTEAVFSDKEKQILERAALTCPVAMSLHPDIKQDVTFLWPN